MNVHFQVTGYFSLPLQMSAFAYVSLFFFELVLAGLMLLSSVFVVTRPRLARQFAAAGLLYLFACILLVPGFGPSLLWTGIGAIGWLLSFVSNAPDSSDRPISQQA